MRSRSDFMQEYVASHRNPVNALIHVICVPVIFFTSTALLWSVPLGRWLGADAAIAPWLNLATVVAVPIALFYARLGSRSFVSGLAWMLVSGLACRALQIAGMPLVRPALVLWLVAWAIQIYGHKIEGAKPSFFDDLVFLLIGPLFVQDKLGRLVTTGSMRG